MAVMTMLVLMAMVMTTSLIPSAGAGFPGAKCGTMGYYTAVGSCAMMYSKGMMERYMAAYKSGNFDVSRMIEYHKETCANGLLNKTIACIDEVHKMCGFSILSTDTLLRLADRLCTNADEIEFMLLCKLNMKLRSFCIDPASFLDPDNPVCSVTGVLKKCLDSMLYSCRRDAGRLALSLGKALAWNQCDNDRQKGGCPFVPYVASLTACYARLLAALPRILSDNTTTLADVCKMTKVTDGLTCHEKVDKRCGLSIVNAAKIRATIQNACLHAQEFIKFGSCVKPDYQAVVKCLRNEVVSGTSVCEMITRFKRCYDIIFSDCSDAIRQITDKLYELIRPEVCTHPSMNPKCSVVSYLGNMGMCWAKSLIGIIARYVPQASLSVPASGNTQANRLCHARLNEMCEGSFMGGRAARDLLLAFWDGGPQIFQKAGSCVTRKPFASMSDCKGVDLLQTSVTDNSSLCRLVNSVAECQMKEFSGAQCDVKVQTFMRSLMGAMTPPQCLVIRSVTPTASPNTDTPNTDTTTSNSALHLAASSLTLASLVALYRFA